MGVACLTLTPLLMNECLNFRMPLDGLWQPLRKSVLDRVWVREAVSPGVCPCPLCARRRMHAHEVPTAPVPAGVVLGLQLWVEPRLHGGPLVRRVAAAPRAGAPHRPTWKCTKGSAFRCSLSKLSPSLSPSLSLLHARTQTLTHPSSSFQNHKSKVTGEAPGIPFFVPSRNSKTYSQASATCRAQSTEGGAFHLSYGSAFLGGGEFKSAWI